MNTRILFVHALSPLHAGTGQSVGAIDLTIARDKATGHPYLPGSSLKGSLRSRAFAAAGADDAKCTALYGPEVNEANQHAGALAFGDANLLAMPVRSIKGTFAWVSSPLLLARFARDAKEAGLNPPALVQPTGMQQCLLGTEAVATLVSGSGDEAKVYFEDLDLTSESSSDATGKWATFIAQNLFASDGDWQKVFTERFCVVHDDVMSFFAQHGTEVVTRIKLNDETKTVDSEQGALWTEENLPAETILSALVLATPNNGAKKRWGDGFSVEAMFEQAQKHCTGSIQLGGKATVGRGRCHLVLTPSAQAEGEP